MWYFCKISTLAIVGIMSTIVIYGQISPGGVKGAKYWYVTDSSTPRFKNNASAGSPFVMTINPSNNALFNFHPSLVFTASSRLPIVLDNSDLSSASFFTVYQSTDTARENNIWHFTRDQKTSLVLTTRRMADLASYNYMNYIDVVLRRPKVNIYVQHKSKEVVAPTIQTLHIGNKPSLPQLPINSFTGLIPELVIYDRPLNSTERLQVASYLALKYGVTLTEPAASYLNSMGSKIWDGISYSDYHHNIAGIGRDDSSGLFLRKASSSNESGLLTMITQSTIPNNSFVLWGDNELPLRPDKKIPGIPLMLQRKWMVVSSGHSIPVATDVVIDTRLIDAPLPPNPVYWLAIDRLGKGTFVQPTTEYIKMSALHASGTVYFREVKWNKSSEKETMSLIVAQELLVSAYITEPTCAGNRKGSLEMHIHSGVSPYHVIIKNSSGLVVAENKMLTNNVSVLQDIAADRYEIKVRDNAGNVYSDVFYVNYADAPRPSSIEPYYLLEKGKSLQLNAANGLSTGISYSWEGPGISSSDPIVEIISPGIYILETRKNNCTYKQEVMVQWKVPDILANSIIAVFPNPSYGHFNVKISLSDLAPISVFIYDMSGRLVDTDKKDGFANYQFTFNVNVSGLYQIVLISGNHKTSRNVLIAR